MSDFTGFPATGLSFLTDLGTHDKAWFRDRKAVYESAVVEPAKEFVIAVGDRLHSDVSPAIQAVPRANGSISPINNDVRFNKNADPFKDYLLFNFWEGPEKATAASLHVRVSEAAVGFSVGMRFTDFDRWRAIIDDDATGAPLADAINVLARRRELDVAGAALKRVPKPYAEDHPRGDLLRHKSLHLRWPEPTPKSVNSAKFVDWCMKRLDACAPIQRWLVDNLS